ncbi:serine/threonine protein phosphatase PP1-2, putative [Entamoeba invadens IP1]|uniref:Serine/threonine-protein phosphatase n=1 Tax=Entamoeba invadens IP1 TaxID=370355 RepID=A0A0A1U0L8_ENTIV|nr:serine/threonine protein phosphatase PP1-2, putative [Entamoeba invadens IP1]ELP86098.1 serine/threonine protein phosphatase PP1-2, putative [Entamoeba invadens IP1]|eukprot:XP_004185444.1 serine/threonine protein phosphatase PP1-2, putative [Entamoeba invadens IP1]
MSSAFKYNSLLDELIGYRNCTKGFTLPLDVSVLLFKAFGTSSLTLIERVKRNKRITCREVCSDAIHTFSLEPTVLRLNTPITVVGDLHGQFYDLLRIFETVQYPPNTTFLFLGDYIDRGHYGVEVVTLLFLLKMKYPKHVYLIRGNHETEYVSLLHGFYSECQKFKDEQSKVFDAFQAVFDYLPLCAIIKEKVFCVHGGISPSLNSLEQIEQTKKPFKIPNSGFLCDLVWSDPNDLDINGWMKSERGMGCVYGQDVCDDFLMKNGFEVILRAHQNVDGYKFSLNKKVVTVFSCPNYMETYENTGAVIRFDDNLMGHFVVFKPTKK